MIRNDARQSLTISALAKKAGVSRSSIHHYIKHGLLTKPVKAHATLSYYDETHLEQLRRIKELRARDKLSLPDIKDRLHREDASIRQSHPFQGINPDSTDKSFLLSTESEPLDMRQETREAIISTAMKLFSTKGYESTTIDAIIATLKMGKGTFYKYFSNKKELFLECVDGIVKRIKPVNEWKEDPFWEQDIKKRWKEGIMHFMNISSIFRSITDVLFVASLSDDPDLKKKAHEQYKYLLHHVEWLIKQDIERGDLKPFDEEIVARFILVTAAALSEYLSGTSRYTFEEGIDLWLDFILHGIYRGQDVEDRKGIKVPLSQTGDHEAVKRDISLDTPVEKDVTISCTKIDSLQVKQDAEGVKLIFESDQGRKFQVVLSGKVRIS